MSGILETAFLEGLVVTLEDVAEEREDVYTRLFK